jgi:xylulokinase
MPYVIGLDVGSSATKVGLLRLDGELAAFASSGYPTTEPLPGRKEQDPEHWWAAAAGGIRKVIGKVDASEILALGTSGHISSFTFVDESGLPLRPAVGFQDQRAALEVDEIRSAYSRKELAGHLGIDLPPAATWPLPKLLWFRKHEPATLERARHLLQAKDFINARLTGEFAGDASSNRGMVDLSTGGVPEEVFLRLGLRPDLLPPLRKPEEVMGTVSAWASGATGLRKGLPVVTGWNDLNACVLGSGAIEPGDTFNITGTSEHIGTVTRIQPDVRELVCAPFLPGLRLLYGPTSCGGGALEWYAGVCGRAIEELAALAESTPPASQGLLFLPYLEGERAPVWDPHACGAFVGLRTLHGQGHLVRAILEGVSFGLRQILEIVRRHAGLGAGPLVISGGAARVRPWNQIKADVLGRAVAVTRNHHAGILGAGMLAAVAAGAMGNPAEASRAMARVEGTLSPVPERVERYRMAYSRYLKMYPALREISAELHKDLLEIGNASG